MSMVNLGLGLTPTGGMVATAGMQTATMLGGMLTGAGIMLLVVLLRPGWLGLMRRSLVSERLEEMRVSLLSELQEIEEEIRTPPPPIRMELREDPDDGERRQVA